jgi:hypothetical protein
MTFLSSSMLALLTIGGVFVLLGAAWIWIGLRGRRMGETPFCRQCGYELTGIGSSQCPECGSILSARRAVVRGRRQPMRDSIYVGSIVAFIGACCVIAGSGRVPRINWYQFKPTSRILADLQSPTVGAPGEEWLELNDRIAKGKLSADQLNRLIELALAQQAAPSLAPQPSPFRGHLIDFLAEQVANGKTTPAQSDRFFRQAFVFSLAVRKQILLGDPITYAVTSSGVGPTGAGMSHWSSRLDTTVDVDGKSESAGPGTSSGGLGGFGTITSWMPCDTPGKHTVTVKISVHVQPRSARSNSVTPGTATVFDKVFSLTGTTEVLPTEPPGFITLINAPELTAPITAAIKAEFCIFQVKFNSIEAMIDVDNAPVDLAFDVILRVGGKETSLNPIHVKKGATNNWAASGKYTDPPPQKADIVLRSSPAAARKTVDMTSIWNGEIVFKDVPVGTMP